MFVKHLPGLMQDLHLSGRDSGQLKALRKKTKKAHPALKPLFFPKSRRPPSPEAQERAEPLLPTSRMELTSVPLGFIDMVPTLA